MHVSIRLPFLQARHRNIQSYIDTCTECFSLLYRIRYRRIPISVSFHDKTCRMVYIRRRHIRFCGSQQHAVELYIEVQRILHVSMSEKTDFCILVFTLTENSVYSYIERSRILYNSTWTSATVAKCFFICPKWMIFNGIEAGLAKQSRLHHIT